MIRRFVWSCLGITFALIGVIGLVLPIIPGILFLLLSAFCFAKAADSSKGSYRGSTRGQTNGYPLFSDSYLDDLRAELRYERERRAERKRRNYHY